MLPVSRCYTFAIWLPFKFDPGPVELIQNAWSLLFIHSQASSSEITRARTSVINSKQALSLLLSVITGSKLFPFLWSLELIIINVLLLQIYGAGNKYKVIVVDCGAKHNIIRCLVERDVEVHLVPWNYDYSQDEYDGLFVTNGPGDPKLSQETIANLRKVCR